jgi:radical SAM superfamily enzyme YgiQ (UPF0313 family)
MFGRGGRLGPEAYAVAPKRCRERNAARPSPMRYEGKVYRPPSEADAYILQATVGCSWNRCTYCDMYRDKNYRERDLPDVLEDLRTAAAIGGGRIDKMFVADGDALGMSTASWLAILDAARVGFR